MSFVIILLVFGVGGIFIYKAGDLATLETIKDELRGASYEYDQLQREYNSLIDSYNLIQSHRDSIDNRFYKENLKWIDERELLNKKIDSLTSVLINKP